MLFEITSYADVAELVDALDLGSSIERCGSSSLPVRTNSTSLRATFLVASQAQELEGISS